MSSTASIVLSVMCTWWAKPFSDASFFSFGVQRPPKRLALVHTCNLFRLGCCFTVGDL